MKNFIKTLFAVLFGNAIFFGVLFFILLLIGIGAGMSGKSSKIKLSDNAILNLNLKTGLSDLSQKQDLKINLGGGSENPASIFDVLSLIKKAKTDDDIKALWISMNMNSELSYAQIDLIRDAIEDFKSSKKPVMAYGEMVSQKMYYLGSVADKVYINPNGGMDVRGFAAQLAFFKKTLDKLEIQPQIFYAGKFKSATEPFRLEKMSEANKVQVRELLMDISDNVLSEIADDRKISIESLNDAINNLKSNTPTDALASKLIDGAKYADEVEMELKRVLSLDSAESFDMVSQWKYMDRNPSRNKVGEIAVYVAEGDIIDGKGQDGSIGSATMASDIREIAEDEDVKALVLRVNSPGGSALASDVILRELELLKKKKPLIVSMGNLAASGGYYISAYGDKIFAEENTITGSIGVFGIIPNMGNMFKNKLGMTFDEVELNEHAAMGLYKNLDATEAAKIQMEIDRIYTTFKSIVAKGRNMSMEAVEEVAQGRVWSGKKAKELKLVDEVGGLVEAIIYAAEKIDADPSDYYFYNYRKSEFEALMEDLAGESVSSSIEEKWLRSKLGDYSKYYDMLKTYHKIKGAQMRMVYQVHGL